MTDREGQSPSDSIEEDKNVLVQALNTLTEALDSIGFYVYDYTMDIDSTKPIPNIIDLRRAAIDGNATISFKLETFISNSVWSAFEEPKTDFFGIEKISLADLYGFDIYGSVEEEN